MHELGSNRAAVVTTRLSSKLTLRRRRRKRLRRQILSQRIKRSLQVSPPAKDIKYDFPILLLYR